MWDKSTALREAHDRAMERLRATAPADARAIERYQRWIARRHQASLQYYRGKLERLEARPDQRSARRGTDVRPE